MADNQSGKTTFGVRETFGNRFGVVAAAAGSAIGLGNIWKFPYITGVNGGAAFIIVYLLCIAIIGLPVMLSEFVIGRNAKKNAIGSFKKLAPGTPWFLTGWMGVIAAFTILSFYGVVAGWTLEYIFRAVTGFFDGKSAEEIGKAFGSYVSSPVRPVFWQLIFMAMTGYIVYAGVKDGIEKYSKILMPMLLVMIVILDIRALTLPGASKGIDFLFKPDFGALTANGVLMALGHAFFSLSLGMGTMITYASYIKDDENLATSAVQVTIADTVIALLAGLAIFPAVFAFGIEPGAGPGLVFITLPSIFNQLPFGDLFSFIFFLLLAVAALTSSISILECFVAYISEELNLSRHKAAIIGTVSISIIGVIASLSMGPWSGFTILGKNIFDCLDWVSANLLLPLGGMFIALFIGWFWGRKRLEDELSSNGKFSVSYVGILILLCKVISPVAILFVFLHGIGVLDNILAVFGISIG
ncbi:MAG TPA: sodium-dependent transporter [Spirochaetota bacterium]|nr:sodium-dependent transporter [Spirochaetota bacterium]